MLFRRSSQGAVAGRNSVQMTRNPIVMINPINGGARPINHQTICANGQRVEVVCVKKLAPPFTCLGALAESLSRGASFLWRGICALVVRSGH